MHRRRVGVVERRDFKLAAIQHQPAPTAGEMIDALRRQLVEQRLLAAEAVVDQIA